MSAESLFKEHQRLIHYIIHKHFSAFEEAYREELISEGTLALWIACTEYDSSRNVKFITYAYCVVRNRLLRYAKRDILKHAQVISLETVIADDGEGGELCIKDTLKTDDPNMDLKETIQECLLQLTETERSIIHRLMEGYTQDMIAKECHVSQPTVSRCLRKFKQIYLKESE